MDIRKIKKLIELVEESGITELEVSEEEGTVRISRAAPAVAPAAVQYAAAPVVAPAAPQVASTAPVAAPAEAPKPQKRVATQCFHQWWGLSTVAQAQMQNRSLKWVKP